MHALARQSPTTRLWCADAKRFVSAMEEQGLGPERAWGAADDLEPVRLSDQETSDSEEEVLCHGLPHNQFCTLAAASF